MEASELNLMTVGKLANDEDGAIEFFESIRWPNGATCPHCEATEPYKLTPKADSKRPVRKGVWKCRKCRKQFSVRVGTIFESSHIKLGVWLAAIHAMCSSKKGVSALQLQRGLDLTYKSAWFLAHRVRWAMRQEPMATMLKGVVEVDETYVGGKPRKFSGKKSKPGRGTPKTPVVALVERDGSVRSRPLPRVNGEALKAEIRANVEKSATIMTDDFPAYRGIGREFDGGHLKVNHSAGEYAVKIPKVTISTNTAESFFALVKRSHYGVHHQYSKRHLPRYIDERSFLWNSRRMTDGERTVAAIAGSIGKRLMYSQPTVAEKADDGK